VKKVLLFFFLSLFFFSCKKQKNETGVLPNGYSDQAIGVSAADLLRDTRYTTLNIEIQYMPGYQLEPGTITNLKDFISTLCNKPGGITVSEKQIASYPDTLTVSKIAVIERQNRVAYTSGRSLACTYSLPMATIQLHPFSAMLTVTPLSACSVAISSTIPAVPGR
jgi:hypothetical protein